MSVGLFFLFFDSGMGRLYSSAVAGFDSGGWWLSQPRVAGLRFVVCGLRLSVVVKATKILFLGVKAFKASRRREVLQWMETR